MRVGKGGRGPPSQSPRVFLARVIVPPQDSEERNILSKGFELFFWAKNAYLKLGTFLARH